MHQKLWMSAKCHTNFKPGVNIATAWWHVHCSYSESNSCRTASQTHDLCQTQKCISSRSQQLQIWWASCIWSRMPHVVCPKCWRQWVQDVIV